ncbi:MAG TPA: TfpX/TfpZ family type IV pilin accessory protein [Steroidobacteraceae bacterium]
MIVWREKLLATAIHFGVTLLLAGIAAALIFLVWFPDPFQTMIGGTELFLLVVGCDLALGPLISLVIYNSRKSRRELVTDYSIVGAVQIAALVYGVFILAGTRPVYVAYSGDRFEIVTAREITETELAAARDPQYRSLPLTGPRYIGIQVPQQDHNDAVFQALAGNEEHMRPKFYVSYESQLPKIHARAKKLEELLQKKPASTPLLDAAMHEVSIPAERVRWLPVHHRKGFWTALIDIDDGKPVAYFDFDPY